MKKCLLCSCIVASALTCCSDKKTSDATTHQTTELQLQDLSKKLTEAETTDDLQAFLQHYDDKAISMPEYQLTLDGRQHIEGFYREMFDHQNIKIFQRQPRDYIHLGKSIVEIGTFLKEYTDSKTDTLRKLTGKYWHVWEAQPDGQYRIKGEAFGFFHPVAHPETLIVTANNTQPDDFEIKKDIPFELKAYNALMEKGVRKRDGVFRSEFFTEDASFYPFADTTVTGMEKIKPYLIGYSSRGSVTIDSIMCYTYDFEYSGDYILEYDMFKVKWSVPGFSGRTEGKGIRIWKRQEDHSLKLYREIGTHNHL
ncbi:MAG: hypothetical protein C0490_04355 [Marivirga sp.]|nr:hypothetical protein [Marivirga sp.]